MNKVKSCPNNLLFGVNYWDSVCCFNCVKQRSCEEIRLKFNIKDEYEKISFSKARDFILEIWGVSWKSPSNIIENARRYGYLDEIKHAPHNTTHVISYENIYNLMRTPLYKTLQKGRIHHEI